MAAPPQVEVSITTQSSPIPDPNNLPAPQPPTITLNGTALPAPSDSPPYQPVGCQVVVLDSSQDMTQPSSIISNQYQIVSNQSGNWGESYRWMWDAVAQQIYSSGDLGQQIVFIATFGLDVLMTPTAASFELFLERGASKELQQWGLLPYISEGGWYIQYPANYVLIGNSGYGYGEGFDKFDYTPESVTVETNITETLDNPGG